MYEPIKQETKELYLKIWSHYAIGNLSQEQLAKLFNCSPDTVANAIKWVAENRTQFPTPVLAEAAKEAVEHKLREFNNDLVRIKDSNPINWNAYIGINKLIKEYQESLWKFQAVIVDRSIVTINSMQVNQVLKARDELVEGMSDEQRQAVISTLREITGKQSND